MQLKRALKQRYNFANIIGKSEPMLQIFDLVGRWRPAAPPSCCRAKAGPGRN